MPSPYHYHWKIHLQATPEALWPLLADTSRFNKDAGLPSIQFAPNASGVVRRLRYAVFGIPLEWDEEPFEWVRPLRFSVRRHYRRGPLAEMRVQAELIPQSTGDTLLDYQVWATARNWFWNLTIPIQIGALHAYTFRRTAHAYDQHVATRPAARLTLPTLDLISSPVPFAPGGRRRLEAARGDLFATGIEATLIERLFNVIATADDLTVARLRPHALADAWGVSRRAVLELCLQAVRAGVLNFQWDVLCPLCRGAKQSADTLSDVQAQSVHCESCNIDFTANFERSVELTFRPNPAIRAGALGEFCVGGPQVTPHIMAQQWLAPNETRTLTLPGFEVGRYRVRARDVRGGQTVQLAAHGVPAMTFTIAEAGWPANEPTLQPHATLQWHNTTAQPQLVMLERMAWSDQAVTATEVTALQTFRDLFAEEALRPGDQIAVGTVTLLFTDLRDSTRLYRQSGDAVAFGRVMGHFDILRAAIAAEEGALVKTIGDAVMAVFLRPVSALRAILNAQMALAQTPTENFPLHLKAGIHTGPCVAVTLNGRLDYFGSTVNLAARLEGMSGVRHGVVISAAVYRDPEVQAWLTEQPFTVEPFTSGLKGFEGEEFELYSVR